MSLRAGDVLTHYEILAPLGRGGMGEVYQARDTKLGRDVAIKVLPDAFAGDEERLQRFEREARLLASLNHPGIATLHGLEQSGETRYLVMELVPGETLAERIARGPLAMDEALPLFIQMAEGIEAAHRHSVLHRDLKPANVKITPEGKIKVLDFGLAKVFDDVPAQAGSQLSQSPTLAYTGTRAGVILGTAPYMSPEQARGKTVDKRTDVWSFACCLFEALAGKQPFRGETVTDTIAAVVRAEPDWSELPAAAPRRLVELLKRCLRKSPEERLRDLGDAKLELEAAMEDPTPSPVAAPARRTPWLVAVGVAAILGFVAAGEVLPDRASIDGGRFSIALAESSSLMVNFTTSSVAVVPDGSHIVYAGVTDGRSRLFVRSRDAFEAIPIAGTEGAALPFVSPDGAWVGYYDESASELKRIPLEGGAPLTIHRTLGGISRGAHWGADGNIYFNGTYYLGIHRIPASGGEPEVLTTPDTVAGEKSHRFPQLLPGSKAVIFSIAKADMASFDDSVIAALTLDTGTIVPLVEGGSQPRYVPSGHLVYARDGGLMAVGFDPDRLEVRGVPRRVLDGVLTSHTFGEAHYDVAADGTLVFAPGGPEYFYTRVELRQRSGQTIGTLDLEPGRYQTARYSPEGKRLAVWHDDGNSDIWVYDLERSAPIRLSGDWDDEYPVWTPDGERIAFSVNREGKLSTWWAAADGSEAPTPLLKPGRPESWSPDGDMLVVRSEGALSLWDRRLDEVRPFTRSSSNASERNGVVSPDGRWIAYHSDASGSAEVYVTSFPEPGARFRVSASGGEGATPFYMKPVWGQDGTELFFNRAEHVMVASVQTGERFEASTAEPLFDVPGLVSFDVAPDGQSVVTVSSNAEPITHLNIILGWRDELERLVPVN